MMMASKHPRLEDGHPVMRCVSDVAGNASAGNGQWNTETGTGDSRIKYTMRESNTTQGESRKIKDTPTQQASGDNYAQGTYAANETGAGRELIRVELVKFSYGPRTVDLK
jgi:hypothetical protein